MTAFDPHERERLEQDPELSIYAVLTTDHVMGLIDAWSNYLVRRGGQEPEDLPLGSTGQTPEQVAAHRKLVTCLSDYPGSEQGPEHDNRLVFSDEQQRELRYYKYTRGFERITHDQLRALLRAVRRYSAVASPVPLNSTPFTSRALVLGFARYFHAHNSLVRFGIQPFTDAEFMADLRQTVFSLRF